MKESLRYRSTRIRTSINNNLTSWPNLRKSANQSIVSFPWPPLERSQASKRTYLPNLTRGNSSEIITKNSPILTLFKMAKAYYNRGKILSAMTSSKSTHVTTSVKVKPKISLNLQREWRLKRKNWTNLQDRLMPVRTLVFNKGSSSHSILNRTLYKKLENATKKTKTTNQGLNQRWSKLSKA